jgi:transmembrane sensor
MGQENHAMNPDQRIRDAAAGWAAQTADPEFGDWDGFTEWLEADPAHARAYDAVQAALDDAVAALESAPEPEFAAANDNPPEGWQSTRRAWLSGAMAASLALVATFLLWLGPQGETHYATAPGETLLIALKDGSTVELGGGSRIVLDDGAARQARLEAGQALFTIRHNADDPFVLTAGGERLVDAGTVFDVRLEGETLDLAVAEGAVIVNPQRQALRVDAGQRAVRRGGRYAVAAVDPGAVGEWARGRITFSEASLPEIAAELTRVTGLAFTAKDTAARLSGSIALDTVRADPRALEPLLGVQVQPAGVGWTIAAE